MTKSRQKGRTDRSEALEQYRRLLNLLGDRVRSVAKGYQTGVYIVGRPGSGKTHTVRNVLEQCKTDYIFLNGRITAAALFEEIAERPQSLLVIDDVSTLFENLQAAQILMAAIGGCPEVPRHVTYVTKTLRRKVEFTGGVLAISNRPLQRDPASRALASRMVVLEHEPTDELLIAFMESEARKGARGLSAKECLNVFEHVVEVCRAGDYRIDLRYYFKGIEDYRCWKSETCETDWRVLIESSLQSVDPEELPPTPATRMGTKSLEYEIVRELHDQELPRETLEEEWKKRTGKSMDSFYRRKRELHLK